MSHRRLLPCALAGLALFFGLWGIKWGLPSLERVRRVLPPEAQTKEFREHLAATWQTKHENLGPEPLLDPNLWLVGFSKIARVPAGWKLPPPVLLNSARSMHVRTSYEDEANVITGLSRIKPHRLQFNSRLYTAYGGLYFMVLGGWVAALAALSPLSLVPSLSFYLVDLHQLEWLYLAARLLSVALYVLGVMLAYAIGKRLWDEETGLWAGLFLAVSPGAVHQSHYLKAHPLGAVALMGVFYFCARMAGDGPSTRLWAAAGAYLGAAAGATNYLWNGGFLLPLALLLRSRVEKDRVRFLWRQGRLFAGALVVALAVFFLTNPFLITEFDSAIKTFGIATGTANRQLSSLWVFPLGGFLKGVTAPLAAWTLLGFLALRLRDPVWVMTACGSLGFFALAWMVQSPWTFSSIRHFPSLFLALMVAARGTVALGNANPRLRGLLRAGAAGVAIWAALVTGVLDYNYYLESVGRSTKEEAGAWIETNVPAGSELGFMWLPQPANAPYFQWSRYNLTFFEESTLLEDAKPDVFPQYLVFTAAIFDIPPALKPILTQRYRLEKEFEPYRLWGKIGPPLAETYGNPVISIYRKL